jgi:hypothetical protein
MKPFYINIKGASYKKKIKGWGTTGVMALLGTW